jgi:hypothetical protein
VKPAVAQQGDQRSEVRTSRKARWIGKSAGCLMRLVGATLQVQVVDRCGLTRPGGISGPVVLALWHNRIFTIAPVWARHCGKHRRNVVLTSASHDGAAVAHAMETFGMGAVRGSSSRRAVAGLIGLRQALRGGSDATVTPDGPRGPRYRLQAGLVKLAQSAGVPVVAIHARFGRAWRLRTWDGMVVPVPFSRVEVVFDEALAVPAGLDEDAFEAWRAGLEERMRAATDDLDFEPKARRKK